MMICNKIARAGCLFFLSIGGTHLLKWWHRKQAIILLYHGISSAKAHLAPELFEKQLQYLKKQYTIISLEQFMNCQQSATAFPCNSLIITFDDGYHNNYTHAFPLLTKQNIPASIFLTTALISTRKLLWFDEYHLHAENLLHTRGYVTLSLRGRTHTLRTQAHLDEFKEELKTATRKQVRAVIDQLAHATKKNSDKTFVQNHRMLTHAQIKHMTAHHISCYPHGHTHAILATLSDKQLAQEILKSLAFAQKNKLDTSCYAYANGRIKDFDDRATTLLAKNGVRIALTTIPGWNALDTEPYAIKRISMGKTEDWNSFLIRMHFGLFL